MFSYHIGFKPNHLLKSICGIKMLIQFGLILCCFLMCGTVSFDESRLLFYPDLHSKPSDSIRVLIDLEKAISEVDEKFLSVALDTSLIVKHWKSVDFSSERFNTLARALSPAYLRVGGNAADFLVFRKELTFGSYDLDSQPYEENYNGALGFKNITKFNMSAHDFDQVNKFAIRNGLRLLFDLNVLLRNAQDQWNSSNAQEILAYSIEKGYDEILLFSLGNEPNSFPHAFNRSLSAHQLGKDFLTLNNLLRNDPRFASHFHNSILVGPDVTQPKAKSLQYLNNFLDVAGSKVNAVTFHQYYIDGRTATLDDMMSLDVLDLLSEELEQLKISMMKRRHANYTLWLGETGSCWGGGATGLSDKYVAGFMWMDKLGLAAKNGIKVIIRQSFFHGHYAMIDNHFHPNPDYWLSWLFKNLIGRKVFSVVVQGSSDLRLYAHCAQQPRYSRGAVAFYGLNIGQGNLTLKFESNLMEQKKHLYWLYPYGHKHLKSEKIILSGQQQPLELIDDHTFPEISPVIIPGDQGVIVGRHSFGFIVFPDARVSECL